MPAIKTRYFMAHTVSIKKRAFGKLVTDEIYEIIDNVPHRLFDTKNNVLSVKYNTSCTRGEVSEIMNTLAINNIIDIIFENRDYNDINKNFEIHLLT